MTEGMDRVNYHTHCERCRHERGSAGEYAEEAMKAGVVKLGFSDHLPFYDDRFGLRMPYSEIEEYMEEIAALREKWKGKMDIFCGFEGEYVREDTAYYEKLLSNENCEYLLLGQHFYETAQGEFFNVYQLKETGQYEAYSANIVEGMRTGFFRYAAHPDLIFLNDFVWDIHCDRACDILIDGAVKYGFALEYNVNGFRREKKQYPDGERFPYPHEKFWERVRGTGIPVFVGSDCHDPRQVYDGKVERSYEKLRESGILPELNLLFQK